MRILLVKARMTAFHGQAVPPLGLMYLSSALKRAGYPEVRILQPDLLPRETEPVKSALLEFKPHIVGLSAITAEARSMHELARLSKRLLPETLVVAGGPHPTGYAADCMNDPAMDVAARGEGELTFLEIVRNHEAGKPLDAIKGITLRSGGRVAANPDREFVEDLDSLPYPDWDAIDIRAYQDFVPHSPLLFGSRSMGVFTSRGCPFHCTFCHNVMGKKFRAHSAGRVLEEWRILHDRHGIRRIEIYDDIFNFDRQRTLDIMRGAAASGMKLKLYLSNGIRGDLLDEEVIDSFAEAGVVYMCTAVETGSPRLQREIRKGIDFGKIQRNVAYAARKRIFVLGFFMMGFPGETPREVFQTIRMACGMKLHAMMAAFCCGYRGTELGDGLDDKRAVAADNDTYTYSGYAGFVNCSPMRDWQLVALKMLMNILFYYNPFRIHRILRDLPERSPRVWSLMLKKLVTRTLLPR